MRVDEAAFLGDQFIPSRSGLQTKTS